MRRASPVFVASVIAVSHAGGCAVGTADPPADARQPGLDEITAQHLVDDLTRGRRTKADVKARLGDAAAIRFASGYEVWVYRIAEAGAAKQRARSSGREGTERDAGGELVILFAPTGEVAKARTRLPPGSG